MTAKDAKKIYEGSMETWLLRGRPLAYDDVIDLVTAAAKATPPNNQVYLTADCLSGKTIDDLRNAGFCVTFLSAEFESDRYLYSISF